MICDGNCKGIFTAEDAEDAKDCFRKPSRTEGGNGIGRKQLMGADLFDDGIPRGAASRD